MAPEWFHVTHVGAWPRRRGLVAWSCVRELGGPYFEGLPSDEALMARLRA
jgi:hypothetical protein